MTQQKYSIQLPSRIMEVLRQEARERDVPLAALVAAVLTAYVEARIRTQDRWWDTEED